MTVDGGVVLLVGRVLYAVPLAFMGLSHFFDLERVTAQADASGVPAARAAVLASGAVLLFGAVAILLGTYPALGAAAVAVFLLVVTPVVHRFWAVPEEERTLQLQLFLRNASLLGGALAFLAASGAEWAYALGGAL